MSWGLVWCSSNSASIALPSSRSSRVFARATMILSKTPRNPARARRARGVRCISEGTPRINVDLNTRLSQKSMSCTSPVDGA